VWCCLDGRFWSGNGGGRSRSDGCVMSIVVLSSFAGEGWKCNFSSHQPLCSVFHSPIVTVTPKTKSLRSPSFLVHFGPIWYALHPRSHLKVFSGFDGSNDSNPLASVFSPSIGRAVKQTRQEENEASTAFCQKEPSTSGKVRNLIVPHVFTSIEGRREVAVMFTNRSLTWS
jgi:hypothetical protein